MKTPWQRSFADHKWLLVVAAVYSVSVVCVALAYGVPARNLLEIIAYIITSMMTALVFLTGVYFAAFLHFYFRLPKQTGGVVAKWRAAVKLLDIASRAYMDGDRWAYACLGFAATTGGSFFFICKSLVPVINPYAAMKWDATFIEWDRALHFGLPHEWLIPFINKMGLAHVLDVTYALWLVVMFMVVGYALFADRMLHRRLRFLWTYVLSWIVLGSACAVWMSSVGPLFYHDFFKDAPDVYRPLVDNLEAIGKDEFFFATKTRQLLLEWTLNDRMFDPNTIAAMPSMHVAIAWLLLLYARHVGKIIFAAAILFCLVVYLATVYFGIHYAVDSYVSIAVVTLIWLVAGRGLRRYAPDAKLQ